MGEEQNQASGAPVLNEGEAGRRLYVLSELHGSLGDRGVRCVLARRQRLVLQYSKMPSSSSGPTDPSLHVFLPEGMVAVTTDGQWYVLPGGERCHVSDPAAAADAIVGTGLS